MAVMPDEVPEPIVVDADLHAVGQAVIITLPACGPTVPGRTR